MFECGEGGGSSVRRERGRQGGEIGGGGPTEAAVAVEEGGGRVRGMAIADPKIGLDKVTPYGGSFLKQLKVGDKEV